MALLTLKRTNRSNPPWLTSSVCTLICLKRQTFNKYANTNRNSDYLKFKKLRNMCAAAVRFEKNAYLNSLSHVLFPNVFLILTMSTITLLIPFLLHPVPHLFCKISLIPLQSPLIRFNSTQLFSLIFIQ